MFISEGHEVTGIDLQESSIESERYRHIACDIRNIDDLSIRSILNIGLTPLNDCVINDPELWAQIMEQTPLKKWATPFEIAQWVYFLTVVNTFCTGQRIVVDGGECINSKFVWK